MSVNFEDMLVKGELIGEDADTCFLAVFKSTEIDQDTWYMGNQVMKKYYAVFDAAAADEKSQDYITFGIAHKVSNLTFDYEQGAVQNVFYDDNGTEIVTDDEVSTDVDVDIELTDA